MHGLHDGGHTALDHVENVVRLDERHLHVELRELGLPVGPQILVAEAARDLHVLVEAADHQKLLENLRRLRQRIERSRVDARGNQIVARPFRRALGQDRRLDFDEALGVEVIADGLDDAMPGPQGALHRRPAQVHIAVFQPQILAHIQIVGDLELGRRRLAENFQLANLDFDRAGLHVLLDHLRRPGCDIAAHHDAELGSQAAGKLVCVRVGFGIEFELHQPRSVAQIDKDHAAVIAAVLDPARQHGTLSDQFGSHVAAITGSLVVWQRHVGVSGLCFIDQTKRRSYPGVTCIVKRSPTHCYERCGQNPNPGRQSAGTIRTPHASPRALATIRTPDASPRACSYLGPQEHAVWHSI